MSSIMGVILAFFVFSILVLFHEFGHFLLAKINGVGVTEFSLGMGPRIVSFVKGGTRYSWKAIPFGGSCAMVGDNIFDVEDDSNDDEDNNEEYIDDKENDVEDDAEDNDTKNNDTENKYVKNGSKIAGKRKEKDYEENSFMNKSVWARISIVAAGPLFNFLLAFLIAIIYIALVGYDSPTVTYVPSGYAAEAAGLKEGDVITEYEGKKIIFYRDIWLYQYVNPVSDDPIDIKYKRDGKEYSTTITPSKAYYLGVSYRQDGTDCVIEVEDDSASDESGLKTGDVVIGVDGNSISGGKEFSDYMDTHPLTGDDIDITVERDGEEMTFTVTPREGGYTLGCSYIEYIKVSPVKVIRYALSEVRYDIESTFMGLKLLITGKSGKDSVSGPVGIAKIVGDSYEETKDYGAFYVLVDMLYLIIIFSANLGVVNLLPFPALDGGRLVFLFIEAVRGKPVSKEKEAYVHLGGIIILMIIMVLVMFNDITKFFRG